MRRYIRILSYLIFLTALPALAEPVSQDDVSKAQGAMFNRITGAAHAYMLQHKLGNEYLTYCLNKLNAETSKQPKDGTPPYGVIYNSITDSVELAQVLSVREDYEKAFLTLCLARAKHTLLQADGKN